jgi:hypothetical protein
MRLRQASSSKCGGVTVPTVMTVAESVVMNEPLYVHRNSDLSGFFTTRSVTSMGTLWSQRVAGTHW